MRLRLFLVAQVGLLYAGVYCLVVGADGPAAAHIGALLLLFGLFGPAIRERLDREEDR